MKPNIRSMFRPVLPTCVFVQLLAVQAQAGSPSKYINPDAAGNVVVAGNHDEINGSDWTVLASGGTGSSYTVDLQSGLLLTGDSYDQNGVSVTSANYAINNRGTIQVASAGVAVSTGSTTIINQSGGLIEGGNSGIRHMPDGGNIDNSGTVRGGFAGIEGAANLSILNQQAGTISGRFTGVTAWDNLSLTNHGTITGGDGPLISGRFPIRKGGAAVSTGNDAAILNSGTISSLNGYGINSGDGLVLTNSGTISGEFGEFDIDTRIVAFDAPVSFDVPVYYGGAAGVATGDDSSITNSSDGVITGEFYGVLAGTNLVLSNSGKIEGTAPADVEFPGGTGVLAGDGAVIDNAGEITGAFNGIQIQTREIEEDFDFFASKEASVTAAPSSILNSGTITGSTGHAIHGSDAAQTITSSGTLNGRISAITTLGGDDEIHLTLGSVVNGDIQGGDGTDLLHFKGGFTSAGSTGNIVHGNVGGIETITKTGSGFAFIGGPGESFNVMADAIEVSSGGLVINGNLMSLTEGKTKVSLSNGGQLDGTGEWAADIVVSNGGISAGSDTSLLGIEDGIVPLAAPMVEPAVNAVGTLTVNGDITHTASAPAAQASDTYIRVDIIPNTPIVDGVNSDLIVQNGPGNTYNLSGVNLRVAPTDINQTLTDGTYTVIDSDSPLRGVKRLGTLGVQFTANAPDTGSFRANQSGDNNLNTVLANHFASVQVTDPAAVAPLKEKIAALAAPSSIAENGSNLEITIQHDFAGLPGLNRNQRAIAAAVDSLVGSANPIYQDFVAALDYSDLATVQATLAALDPANSMGLAVNVINGNYRLHRLAQEHLATVRGSGREVSEASAPVTDAKGAIVSAGAASTRLEGRANAWGTFSFDSKDHQASGAGSDYDGDEGAITAGFDWLVASNLIVGLVLDGTKGDFDNSGFDSDVDGFRGAVYGTWGEATGFYSDALLGFGAHDLESSLSPAGVLLGGIGSDTSANSVQALWTAGYSMGNQSLKHGPYAGLEYQNVDVDSHTQSGPLPVSVGGYDVDSLRALIGYRINANLGTWRPYATLAYAHEFEDGATATTATLAGTAFTTRGAELGSAILITAGTGIDLTRGFIMDFGYRGEIATDDGMTSHGGSLGVNYSF